VAGVFARRPGLLALQAAALADLAPGRCVVASVRPRGRRGLERGALRRRWRACATLSFLRRALAGERVDAEFRLRRARLPAGQPPSAAAALRAALASMLWLAARGDESASRCSAPGDVPRVLAEARAAGESATSCGASYCPAGARVRAAAETLTQYLSLPTSAFRLASARTCSPRSGAARGRPARARAAVPTHWSARLRAGAPEAAAAARALRRGQRDHR
jgi:hypothetical protein